MADTVDTTTRSRMMANIRSKNTKPELALRKTLHKRGFRYRLHVKDLPGKPDIVLPSLRAIVLVHGCFWHGHDCPLFKPPKSRQDYWNPKIQRNKSNDAKNVSLLLNAGWRVCIVTECAIRWPEHGIDKLADQVASWLRSDNQVLQITGKGSMLEVPR
jgi:DNA mismatch endonuclease, patch repair protein